MKALPPLAAKNVMVVRRENAGSPSRDILSQHGQTLPPRVIREKRVQSVGLETNVIELQIFGPQSEVKPRCEECLHPKEVMPFSQVDLSATMPVGPIIQRFECAI